MSISTSQIGELIKVETTYDEQITGEIYCYDKSSAVLVLRKKIENSEDYDIVMIKQPYIKSVEVIKKGKIDGIVLPAVSFPVIGKREKEGERELRSRQIPKTSPYGNYVFAHLSKYAACQWDGDIIVVNGSVQIVDPYGMENVRGDERGIKEVKALLEKMK